MWPDLDNKTTCPRRPLSVGPLRGQFIQILAVLPRVARYQSSKSPYYGTFFFKAKLTCFEQHCCRTVIATEPCLRRIGAEEIKAIITSKDVNGFIRNNLHLNKSVERSRFSIKLRCVLQSWCMNILQNACDPLCSTSCFQMFVLMLRAARLDCKEREL